VPTPHAELARAFPAADAVARVAASALAVRLGVPARRAATLRAVAGAVASGALALDGTAAPAALIEQLVALPGVGPWTAQYLAMRLLRWPDAFPEDDLGLRKALGGVSARQAHALAEPWRPWRAYGATHLWTERRGAMQP
jgi:AraC family transcriptional regulator of adaptative response / DNA-3-methyladenine glycosylase II